MVPVDTSKADVPGRGPFRSCGGDTVGYLGTVRNRQARAAETISRPSRRPCRMGVDRALEMTAHGRSAWTTDAGRRVGHRRSRVSWPMATGVSSLSHQNEVNRQPACRPLPNARVCAMTVAGRPALEPPPPHPDQRPDITTQLSPPAPAIGPGFCSSGMLETARRSRPARSPAGTPRWPPRRFRCCSVDTDEAQRRIQQEGGCCCSR